MASEAPLWQVERASALLEKLLAEDPEPVSNPSLRQQILPRLAVQTKFTLAGNEIDALSGDVAALPRIPGQPQWHTLKPEARQEGFRLLGSLSAMDGVRRGTAIPEPDLLQQAFDAYLTGDFSAADSADIPRLEAALQVTVWLAPYATSAPSAGAIEKRLALRRLLYPMERLTSGFMGREDELRTLRSFVGILDPKGRIETVVRYLSDWRANRPPLMLHGIGGSGKSTLLAEFIRQHVSSPVPFPWVYLDFDNPRLNVALLSTLLNEAADQLSAQYPGSQWTALRSLADERSSLEDAASYTSAAESHTLNFRDVEIADSMRGSHAEELAAEFARHVRVAIEGTELEKLMRASEMLPLLIVLDTFEEVQRRGVETARTLWRFLRHLARAFPRLRVIVSGRAQAPEMAEYAEPDLLALKPFDEPAAISYLMARGVSDEQTARALYKQVGGIALSLKLAAQIARTEPAAKTGISGLKTSSYLIFAAAEHQVQGQLYRRILDRLPGDEIQKLAHPGLVVRRVTPQIIQEVLAEPCDLKGLGLQGAMRLFDLLQSQVDLVTVEPDGALRHQQDIRRVMLKMLEIERPDQVARIHRNAYDYYTRNDNNWVAHNERVYHGLQLPEPTSELVAALDTQTAQSIFASVDELPPASQLFVYERAGNEPPAELRALAGLDQWEKLIEPKARQAIQFGDYQTVEKLLAERQERTPGSALYAIAAVCFMSKRDLMGAMSVLRAGIDSAQSVSRVVRLVELYRLLGELEETLGDAQRAEAAFHHAQDLAIRVMAPQIALQICAQRARLSREVNTPSPLEGLNELLKLCGDTDFAAVRLQLRGLFEVCGPRSVPLLLKGLRVFRLDLMRFAVFRLLDLSAPDEAYAPGRTNELLQRAIEQRPQDERLLRAISDMLEDALSPSRSSRTR